MKVYAADEGVLEDGILEDEKDILKDIRSIIREFYFGSDDLYPHFQDGNWVTFFRIQNENVIQAIDEAVGRIEFKLDELYNITYSIYDYVFIFGRSVIDTINENGSNISDYLFRIVSNTSDFENILKRHINNQTTSIIYAIDNISQTLNSNKKYIGDYLFRLVGYVSDFENILKRHINNQTTSIIDAINNISSNDGETINVDLEPIKNILENIEKNLKDLRIVNDSGKTIWDFLTELINGVTAVIEDIVHFLETLMDFLKDVFIPENTAFIENFFENVNSKLNNKFKFITDLQDLLNSTFSVQQKDFTEDYYINFPVYGNIKVIETSYINKFLPVIRQALSGFMILMTAFWAYRKITGTGGVIE